MTITGIRIADRFDYFPVVTLKSILSEVINGEKYRWAILFLDGVTNENQEKTIFELKKAISTSNNCLKISWEELLEISNCFFQIYGTIILGCFESQNLKNYKSNEEMYTSCDIVIELIDCSWWEVFSKDPCLIQRYVSKFKNTEPLDINHAS